MIEIPSEGFPLTRLEAFRDRLFEIAEDSIALSTAAIVHIDGDKFREIRSGVFLQIDQMKFLVTAAHGIPDHLSAGRPPFLLVGKDKKPIALHNECFWTTKDPNIDLAVTQLHESTVEYLGDHYRFLRLTEMMSKNSHKHQKCFYMLMGFPFARLEPDEDGIDCANGWKYLTHEFLGDYSQVTNYNPEVHVIVRYERDTRLDNGKLVHPPGLSGCGLWYVGDPFSATVLTADDLKLVAIQTAWHKGIEYVKCTWINSVLRVIWEYYPDTRTPMQIHGMHF